MIRWNNDYNRGAHPAILQAFADTNEESFEGYGLDEWCAKAAKCCAVRGGMCRMRWLCLRALKMFRLCCVSARI